MSAIAKPRLDLHPPRRRDRDESVVLYNVSWDRYKKICDAFDARREHLTYDSGVLEIMTLSGEHEGYKHLFAVLIGALARIRRKPIRGFGSFTHQREDLEKGMEPDECFYLASLPAVRGKRNIDLTRDPPPDLAIEIDISSKSVNRLRIYAALGVPEVWQFDGNALRVLLLSKGHYEIHDESPTFPGFAIQKLVPFLDIGINKDDTAMVEALEKWLSKQKKKR